MYYAVKVEYDTPTSDQSFTDIIPFPSVRAAVAVFNPLMEKYPYGDSVHVRARQTGERVKIEIVNAWLYQADADGLDDMVRQVKNESATLIDWTGGLDDLED